MADLSLSHFEESLTRTKVSNALRTDPIQASTAISQATKHAASLRDHAGMVTADVALLHENYLQALLNSETDDKVKVGLSALLVELTEGYGLGWSDIARLVKVSVPAIRKWRNGGEISPQRLHAVAQLAAFLKILHDNDVVDPAAWIATPISPEVDRSLTKASMYADGHSVPLLAYADDHISLEQLLRLVGVAPDKIAAKTQLVRGEDGSISIVPLGS